MYNNNNNNNNCFIGRILDINDNTVTIFDGHSALKTFQLSDKSDFKCGDIIRVECTGSKVIRAKLICKTKKNPFEIRNSLPNRFLCENLSMQLKRRAFLKNEIRSFFNSKSYTEAESQVLVDSPGVEIYLEGFATNYYDFDKKAHRLYLPTSPEYGLKSFVGASLSSVYSFARSFRNYGEESVLHKKEFTMLEWYVVFENYKYLIDELECLLAFCAKQFLDTYNVVYGDKTCDFSKTHKYSMKELFAAHGINLDDYTDNANHFISQIRTFYEKKQISLSDDMRKDDYFFKFFMDNIEPTLGFEHPCIVYDYPIEMCPLSLPSEDSRYGQRFEAYVFGIELANGYTELVDYEKQLANFKQVLADRLNVGEVEQIGLPTEFLEALQMGVPPCTGCALGFDRLFMILSDLENIHFSDWF